MMGEKYGQWMAVRFHPGGLIVRVPYSALRKRIGIILKMHLHGRTMKFDGEEVQISIRQQNHISAVNHRAFRWLPNSAN